MRHLERKMTFASQEVQVILCPLYFFNKKSQFIKKIQKAESKNTRETLS